VTFHQIPLERRTLHGHFSCDLEPVLTIDPGDSVRLSTPNAGWWLESREQFEPRDDELDAGHALAGPIEVRGAQVGQVLSVRIDTIRPGSWGITPVDEDHALWWELDGSAGTARAPGYEVALRPFLGVLGMPPPDPGIHSTAPPRRFGGNIDCQELEVGATLFLPVSVEGALFSAGDGHARQGDGEVCGCAIECPIEAELTLDLQDEMHLEWPVARTAVAWIAFGFDEDLDAAAAIATKGIVDLLRREHDVDEHDGLALASVVADLRVTQVVNGVKGVHAVLPHDAIRFTTIS
jgi:acetamidase/formamidase